MITYIRGDATEPIGDKPKYLCHIVNDIKAWGAGFALALGNKFPHVKADYLSRPSMVLGNIYLFPIGHTVVATPIDSDDICIVHMCAQHGLRSRYNPRPVDYDALRQCLRKVKFMTGNPNSSIHMPRIGAGLGGGKWPIISKIIEEEFFDQEVFVYEL